MNSIKHSKYRNTSLIFELLTRQITVDLLNESDSSKALGLVKKYYKNNTELKKEYVLYQALLSENFSSEERAKSLLEHVLKAREKLDEGKLESEKYDLIGEIKDGYPLNDFFKSRVSNYKEHASIYKLFKTVNESEKYHPSDLVRSKYTIIEHIIQNSSEPKDTEKVQSKMIEAYRSEKRELRLYAQKIMIKRFNEKYGTLIKEQRELLKKYINNLSNTNNLKEHISNEVDRVKKEFKSLNEKVDCDITRIKLAEAIDLIDNIKSKSYVTENEVTNLLMYYQLLEEVTNKIED